MISARIILVLGCLSVLVHCKPSIEIGELIPLRQKRFINPSLALEGFAETGVQKIRTKRSEEECKKLQLCKLHARSQRDFVSAFQLYFVNRENARLWDHRARSEAACERRYAGCW